MFSPINEIARSFVPYDPPDLEMYVIVVDGKRVALRSGKYIFASKHAAKCALTGHKNRVSSSIVWSCEWIDDLDRLGRYIKPIMRRMLRKQFDCYIKQHICIMSLSEYINAKKTQETKTTT